MTRGLVAALAAALALAPAPAAAPAAAPPTSAEAAIVMEASTGDVAFAQAADERRPIASTTKLMTALVTLRRSDLDDVLPAADYESSPVESLAKPKLAPGEELTVRDLLRALLLSSANDAAVTLAEGVSGSTEAFVRTMNREARRLGLRDTRFANPIGLDDPQNYSTARDLARLALALRRSAFARRTFDLERATLRSGDRTRRAVNRNELVREVPWVDGVKTGFTSTAGYILIGSATRGGVTVVSVVLGEPGEEARNRDTLALLRWGLRRYERVRPVRRGEPLARAAVRLGGGTTVALGAARSVRRVVPRGARVSVTTPRAPRVLEGPLPAGRRVGTVVVRAGRRVVARVPLVTLEPVPEPSTIERVKETVAGPAVVLGVVAAVLLIGSLLVIHVRRRRRRARREAERAARRARRKTLA